jgi:hypothetical protein
MNIQFPIPNPVLLGFLAPSYLIGHRWGTDLARTLVEAGVWSEEVFRGDRLPSLPFPESSQGKD